MLAAPSLISLNHVGECTLEEKLANKFSHPDSCDSSLRGCSYSAHWMWIGGRDDIDFDIYSADSSRWTGIAFQRANDPELDAVMAYADADTGTQAVLQARVTLDGVVLEARDASDYASIQ